MTAKSLISIAVAGLALSLAATSTASARNHTRQERHAVRNHGHDDRNIVRNAHHGTVRCHHGYGGTFCSSDHGQVTPPTVRDHRTTRNGTPRVRDHRTHYNRTEYYHY